MDSPKQEKHWQARNQLQKLIDGACLHDRDSAGKRQLWRDQAGSAVDTGVLKGVLNALLVNYPNMYPPLTLIANRCGKSTRTVQRALDVLQAREILLVEAPPPNRRGGKCNRYLIVATKLALLGSDQQLPLWNQRPHDTTAPTRRHGAPDHTTPQHRPHDTSVVLTTIPRSITTTTTTGAESSVVVREFSSQEREQIAAKANQFLPAFPATTPARREMLWKVATLWQDGFLLDWEATEIIQTMRDNERRIDDKQKYLKGALRKKLRERGLRVDQLFHDCQHPGQQPSPPLRVLAPSREVTTQ